MHIIIMLLLISLLILVHELGHFSVARLLKISVDKFGFGLPFGPTLWEKKIGDVTYCIHAFLLGGYVSFPDDDPESELPEDDPGRLLNRPVWQRALVISAGVVANALLAFIIVIAVVIFGNGVPTDSHRIYVDALSKDITMAKDAGMKPGDRIEAINGIKINSYPEFTIIKEYNRANDNYVVNSDTIKQLKNIIQANKNFFEKLGYNPEKISSTDLKTIETTIIPENYLIKVPEPAYEKFSQPDLEDPFVVLKPMPKENKLTSLEKHIKLAIKKNRFAGNGQTTFEELARASADTKHLLTITVERDGKEVNIPVSPDKTGIIGFRPRLEKVFIPATSIGQVISGSWDYLYSKTALMCVALFKIFTGQISLWDLHGIVAITKVGGDIIQTNGMLDAWLLTALISINLAIVNLLPIPALDGGHLVFLLLEKVRGKPVKEKYLEAATKFGFLFLIGLMIFIIFNDILGIVTGKF